MRSALSLYDANKIRDKTDPSVRGLSMNVFTDWLAVTSANSERVLKIANLAMEKSKRRRSVGHYYQEVGGPIGGSGRSLGQ